MRRAWILVPFMMWTAACGDPEAELDVKITDAQAALTDGGGDELFSAQIDEAEASYDAAGLVVRYSPAEGDPVDLDVELDDADEDDKAGKGDTLIVREPADNVFGLDAAGQSFDIAILVTEEGADEPRELWSGTWEADPAE